MSRGYRVRLRERALTRVSGTVQATDSLSLGVDLMPVLPEPEMTDLLRAGLEADGWKADGAELVLDLADGLSARLAADGREIRVVGQVSREVVGSGEGHAEAEARMKANRSQGEARLQADLARRLDRAEASLHGRLNDVVQRIYIEALKRKAGRLGEITSMDERMGEGGLELTIKVKV